MIIDFQTQPRFFKEGNQTVKDNIAFENESEVAK
jgi:hypothetical protein